MLTTTDSLVINPCDAQLQFALMQTERTGALEDMMSAMSVRQEHAESQLAHMQAQVANLLKMVEALPRPKGYYFHLLVPTGTTREQVEQALIARWAELGLATDGLFRTGFCAAVTPEHDCTTKAYVRTSAHVFVFYARGLMPHQARQWVMSSMAGSALWGDPLVLHYDPEIEYFSINLAGERAWMLYPDAVNNNWVQEEMDPMTDRESEVEEWMDLAYAHGMPCVWCDGEEIHKDFSRAVSGGPAAAV